MKVSAAALTFGLLLLCGTPSAPVHVDGKKVGVSEMHGVASHSQLKGKNVMETKSAKHTETAFAKANKVDSLAVMTVNVGVYMLGDVVLRPSDFSKLPPDVQEYIASIPDEGGVDSNNLNLEAVEISASGNAGVGDGSLRKTVRKLTESTDIQGKAFSHLNEQHAAHVMQMMARQILARVKKENPDVLMTQEDVLVRSERGGEELYVPVFKEVYAAAGYKLVSFCESHLSFSPTLNGIYGQGKVKLGNSVYVRYTVLDSINSSSSGAVKNLDNPKGVRGEAKCSAAPRCAASVTIEGVSIFNVHLCGGRYDDTSALSSKEMTGLKIREVELLKTLNADIIGGDFNSALIPTGYDYSYPKWLKKTNENLSEEEKGEFTYDDVTNWVAWQSGALTSLMNGGYSASYSNPQETQPTTYRGDTTVDWVFARGGKVELVDNRVVEMYTCDKTQAVTDHQAVLATYKLH